MKYLLSIFALVMLSNGLVAQDVSLPKGYKVIYTVKGDLDSDGIEEMVFVCDTKIAAQDYDNVPRQLLICKEKNGVWSIWHQSSTAIYGSCQGGAMGDPFMDLKIENGILIIEHMGGGSWKWSHTDKYKLEKDQFYLIGYVGTNGRPCDYWMWIDYDLTTGKIVVKKEFEDCESSENEVQKVEEESFFNKDIKLKIEDRNIKDLEITTPKFNHNFYLSVSLEED